MLSDQTRVVRAPKSPFPKRASSSRWRSQCTRPAGNVALICSAIVHIGCGCGCGPAGNVALISNGCGVIGGGGTAARFGMGCEGCTGCAVGGVFALYIEYGDSASVEDGTACTACAVYGDPEGVEDGTACAVYADSEGVEDGTGCGCAVFAVSGIAEDGTGCAAVSGVRDGRGKEDVGGGLGCERILVVQKF